jgi:hypothetical protein
LPRINGTIRVAIQDQPSVVTSRGGPAKACLEFTIAVKVKLDAISRVRKAEAVTIDVD